MACRSLMFFKEADNLGRLNCVINSIDKDTQEAAGLFDQGSLVFPPRPPPSELSVYPDRR